MGGCFINMGNQIYLTPSQVEELRELGVEFEETNCAWLMYADGTYERSVIGKMNLATIRVESAPSLQEVLDKLPTTIILPTLYDGEMMIGNFNLLRMTNYDATYMATYHNLGYDFDIPIFDNHNPLLASFELLKWVAKRHPESLINKTEYK